MTTYFLQCPACKEGHLCEGPSGGLCINMTCDKCKAWFNVACLPDGYRVVGKQSPDGSHIDANWEPVKMVPAPAIRRS